MYKKQWLYGKFLSLACILALIAVLFSACGNDAKTSESASSAPSSASAKPSEAASPSPSATPEAKPSEGPDQTAAEITIYGIDEQSLQNFWGDKYKTDFPNYKLNFISGDLRELVVGGQQIDIVWNSLNTMGKANGLIDVNLQYDMSELVEKHNVDLSRFQSVDINAAKSMGGLYMLPAMNNIFVLFYNKDIFDRFGEKYPKEGMTWEELAELAKKFNRTEDGVKYQGFTTSFKHTLLLNQLSMSAEKDGKAAIDNEQWKGLLETSVINPLLASIDQSEVTSLKAKLLDGYNLFTKFKTAAMFGYFNGGTTDQKFVDVNWDITTMPVFSNNPGVGTQPLVGGFSITSTSKVKDQAMNLIKYVTSDDAQMILSKKASALTVLNNKEIQDAFGSDTAFKDKNLKAIFANKFAEVSSRSTENQIVLDEILKVIPNVLSNTKDINSALREAEEAANQAITAKK